MNHEHGARYVRVIVDRAIHRELDYSVPENLAGRVGVGSRVRVPFRDKSALATVVAILEHSDAKGVRPIEAIIGEAPALSEHLLELARWIGTYYCCPIETVMRSMLPQVIRRAEVSWKKQLFVQPGRNIDQGEIEKLRRRAPRQAELLEAISKLEKPTRAAEFLRQTSLDNQTLRALVKRGLAELREEAVVRDPHGDEQFIATSNLVLNQEQTHALNEVEQALDATENARPICSTASRVPAKRKSICRPSAGRSTTDARQLFSSPKSRLRRKRWNALKAGSPRRRTTSLFCTVTCPRANATTNGTKFIPVALGS